MIPRLIHRVWLGPYEQPAEFDYLDAWLRINPTWGVCTWTDANVEALFPLITQPIYDDAPTYVHRADLVLVEAVRALGGVGVGFDMEPLQPLEPLIGDVDCFCTPDADGFAGGAFFGATARHPAIVHVLTTIRNRVLRDGFATGWHQPHVDTGPWAWGEAFGRWGERCADHGMALLGDYRTAYPIRYWEKHLFDDPDEYARRTLDSVVVHRFAGSWLRPDLDLTVRRPADVDAP